MARGSRSPAQYQRGHCRHAENERAFHRQGNQQGEPAAFLRERSRFYEYVSHHRPSFLAWSIISDSRSSSASLNFARDISSRAATACSAELSKKVCSSCFIAD